LVVRVAAPLVVYFGVILFVTLLVTHKLGFGYKLAATQSFIAASNNFELAIAVSWPESRHLPTIKFTWSRAAFAQAGSGLAQLRLMSAQVCSPISPDIVNF
jgi:ACR3 family arsenite efflux pump ArsB